MGFCGPGDDLSTDCEIDGGPGNCSTAFGLASIGAASECPAEGCGKWGTDPYTGQQAYLYFTAGAGGATGYLSGADWSLGVNEVNGSFMSEVGYQAYIRGTFLDALNAQLAYVIQGLEDNKATDLQVKQFIKYASENFDQIYEEGGNFNFSNTGFSFTCGDSGRCADGLDFSHKNGLFFHRDTADPLGNFPTGLLQHVSVDLLGGNLWWTVIPRN